MLEEIEQAIRKQNYVVLKSLNKRMGYPLSDHSIEDYVDKGRSFEEVAQEIKGFSEPEEKKGSKQVFQNTKKWIKDFVYKLWV